MSHSRPNRIGIAALVLAAPLVLLAEVRNLGAEPDDPSEEELRALVEGYAHAVETNNRELALRYVHPRSPRRAEVDAALRDQLESYLERARTSKLELEEMRAPDGTVSAKVDQEIVRVFGMKLTRGTRRSVYHFRELGASWRIWGIDELSSQ